MSKSIRQVNLNLRILGRREGRRWSAHCLEMDIVGTGATFEKACQNVIELVETQVSFAFFKGQPEMLDHPAPASLFLAFERINQKKLASYPSETRETGFETTNVAMPKPSRSRFVVADA